MQLVTKLALGIVATVLVLALALVLAITLILDPNDYRAVITQTVQEHTGRTLALDGELGLRFLPCCGITVGSASLSNPDDFPAGHTARLDAATLSVRLWPLLTRREVTLGNITLRGLDVQLIQLADGRANWTFTQAPEHDETSDQGSSLLDATTIAGLRIEDGAVRFVDEISETEFGATSIRLQTGTIEPNAPFRVDLSFDLREADYGVGARLELTTMAALAADRVTLTGPAVSISAPLKPLLDVDGQLRGTLRAAGVSVDPETLQGDATEFTAELEVAGVRTLVNGSGTFTDAAASFDGQIEVPSGSARDLIALLGGGTYAPPQGTFVRVGAAAGWALRPNGLTLDDITVQLDDTSARGHFEFDENHGTRVRLIADQLDLDRYLAGTRAPGQAAPEPVTAPLDTLAGTRLSTTLSVEALRTQGYELRDLNAKLNSADGRVDLSVALTTLGGGLKLTGQGETGPADPYLTGDLELTNTSPRRFLDQWNGQPLQTADPDAFTRLSGATRWRLEKHSLALTQMSWKLDDTRINGNLRIGDFDNPTSQFDLTLDQIDLDRYLEPDDDADNEDSTLPVEVIRELKLAGTLRANALTVLKMPLSNFTAGINAANGVLRLAPLSAQVYGGEYRGDVTIDARTDPANVTVDQRATSVALADLLGNFYASDRLSGSMTFQLTASGRGNTDTQLLRGMAGDFSLNLSDGVYRGMDIVYEIQRARALFRREPGPAAPEQKQTPIRSLGLSGRLIDGVLQSEDLAARIPYLELTGKGGINLLERALDYQLNAHVLSSPQAGSSEDFADLVNATIPLTVKGSTVSPRVSVDVKSLAVNTVKRRAQDALLKRLGGDPASQTDPSSADKAPADQAPTTRDSGSGEPEDIFKRTLRDLLKTPKNGKRETN